MLTHWLKSLRQTLIHRRVSGGNRRGARRRQAKANGLANQVEQLESRELLSAAAVSPVIDVADAEPAMLRMYRSYNPNADYTIFTTQEGEHNILLSWGYHDQTTGKNGFNVSANDDHGAKPIHRLYNPNNGQHYFTLSDYERDYLDQVGWNVEPDMGYAYDLDNQQPGATEVFMLYKKVGGDHIFTADATERDRLLAEPGNVWEQQRSLGFGFAVDTEGRLTSFREDRAGGDVTEQISPDDLRELIASFELIEQPIEPKLAPSDGLPAGGFHSFHIGNENGPGSISFYNGPKATVHGTLHVGNDASGSPMQPFVTVLGVEIPLNISARAEQSIELEQLDGQSVALRGVFIESMRLIPMSLVEGQDFRFDPEQRPEVVFKVGFVSPAGQETGPFIDTMEYRFVDEQSELYRWLAETFDLRREPGHPDLPRIRPLPGLPDKFFSRLDGFFSLLDVDVWRMFEEELKGAGSTDRGRFVPLVELEREARSDMEMSDLRVPSLLNADVGSMRMPADNAISLAKQSTAMSSSGRGIVAFNSGVGSRLTTTSAIPPQVVDMSFDASTNASRGVTRSFVDSVVSTVGDWYDQAGSAWNQTINTLGFVAQDWSNQLTNAWGNSGQMFDYFTGGKNIYDAVDSFGNFWSDPTSMANIGSVLNDFIGLPGVIDSQPWSTYEQDWLKAANDVLDIGLSLGEGHYWDAVDTAIPNIFQAGDLLSQNYFPDVIDTLSGWGASALDYLGINPWNPTSFGGSTDWQHGFQQLAGIGEGFISGGFTGAARESIDPILQFGNDVGQFYFGNWIDSLSNGAVDFLNQYNLNPYGWGGSGTDFGGSGDFHPHLTFDENAPEGANLYGWSDTYGYDDGTGLWSVWSGGTSGGMGGNFQNWFGDYGSTGWASYDTDPNSALDPDFFNNLGEAFGWGEWGGYGSEYGTGWGDSGTLTFDEYASDNGSYDWMSGGDYGSYNTGWFGGDTSSVFSPGFFDGLNLEQYGDEETPTPHYELHGFDNPSSWAASWDPIYQMGSYGSYASSYDTGYGGYNSGSGSYGSTSYSTDDSSLTSAYQDALSAYNKRFEYDY